eukprot:gene4498-7878_t
MDSKTCYPHGDDIWMKYSCDDVVTKAFECSDKDCQNCIHKKQFRNGLCVLNDFMFKGVNLDTKDKYHSFKCSNKIEEGMRIGDYKLIAGSDEKCIQKETSYNISGSANCLRIRNSKFYSRTVCMNNQLTTFQYSNEWCEGNSSIPLSPTFNLNECKNGIELTECENFIQISFGYDYYYAVIFMSSTGAFILVYSLFLGKRCIIGVLHLLLCQCSSGIQSLRLLELLLVSYPKMFQFCGLSYGRLLSVFVYFLNYVFFFILTFWYESWYTNIGICPKYVLFFNSIGFHFTFSLFTTIMVISASTISFSFCLAFFYSSNTYDSMFIEKIGIFNKKSRFYYSKWSLNDPISIILLSIISFLNLMSGLIGFLLLHQYLSDLNCRFAHILTFSILLMITFTFGVVSFLWLFFTFFMDIAFCCNKRIKKKREEEKLVLEDIKTTLSKKPAKFWDKEQFKFWLKLQGFEKYSKSLGTYSVNTLKNHLTIDEIYKLGITDEHHQKSLIALFSNINPNLPYKNSKNLMSFKKLVSTMPVTWDIEKVMEFLDKFGISPVIAYTYALNGSYFMSLSVDEIRSMLQLKPGFLNDQRISGIWNLLHFNPLFHKEKGYKSWNSRQVQQFFYELGINESNVFCTQKIVGAFLPNLKNIDCLRELGIDKDHYFSVISAIENIDKEFMNLNEVRTWVNSEFENSIIPQIKKYAIHGALLLSMDENYITNTFPTLRKSNMKQKALLDKLDTLRYKYDIIPIQFQSYSVLDFVPSTNPEFNSSFNPEIEEEEISFDQSKEYLLGTSQGSQQGWEDENLCKICLDKEKCMLTLPCRHISMCEDCFTLVSDCPICRTQIQSTIKVFSV